MSQVCRNYLALFVGIFCTLWALLGCRSRPENFASDPSLYYRPLYTEIEVPEDPGVDSLAAESSSVLPHGVREATPQEEWLLSLEETVQIALANSQVMRDLGGRVINNPQAATSVYDVAITQSDLQFGPEAALSAFDAQLAGNLIFNRNERTLNNVFFGGGIRSLVENNADFDLEVNKLAATGSRFAVRNTIDYTRNNAPANLFSSAYETVVEAEVVHPLLQGSGIRFNRIVGPQVNQLPGQRPRPGNYNGVLIGRVRTDITLADFERQVRDFLVNVEQTYWQLYFSYRNLDSALARRDAALQTWRSVNSRYEAGIAKREEEALARAEFYAAQAGVENAFNGSQTSGLLVGTTAGVYTRERQLRLLMGVPINDGRLIRPSTEPSKVDVVFDWDESIEAALARRVELRRQKWLINQREMELFAAENFLRMRLDFVGRYRWRGFGDGLLSDAPQPNSSAFADLLRGDLQEWTLGLQLSTPIGNRIGHTAVRNAEWQLARERALLRDQELNVVHDLSRSFAEMERAFATSRAFFNRRIATLERLESVRAEYEAGEVLLEQLLDAQRQATEADGEYFRALVEYNIAVLNVHLNRGTALGYFGVYLSEGPWSPQAHNSAAKQSRRFREKPLSYIMSLPDPFSRGAFPQRLEYLPAEQVPEDAEDLPADGPRPQEAERLPVPRSEESGQREPGPQRLPLESAGEALIPSPETAAPPRPTPEPR